MGNVAYMVVCIRSANDIFGVGVSSERTTAVFIEQHHRKLCGYCQHDEGFTQILTAGSIPPRMCCEEHRKEAFI